jgi:hypothetical protein
VHRRNHISAGRKILATHHSKRADFERRSHRKRSQNWHPLTQGKPNPRIPDSSGARNTFVLHDADYHPAVLGLPVRAVLAQILSWRLRISLQSELGCFGPLILVQLLLIFRNDMLHGCKLFLKLRILRKRCNRGSSTTAPTSIKRLLTLVAVPPEE